MKSFVWIFISIAFFSCEKDINLKLDPSDNKVVVDASIENGRPPIVFLSNSIDYFSKINPSVLSGSFIHNATVTISDGVRIFSQCRNGISAQDVLRQHGLALDIGAHTGIYTLAAHAANPATNVLSFEPSALNYARLTLNLRANGLATTDAYPVGISNINGMRSFTIRTHADYHSSGGTFEAVDGGRANEVHVAALDSFLPAAVADQADLIKLDVEGHEPAALTGMRTLLARAHPTMIFECLTEATSKAVDAALRPLGYRFFEIDDRAGTIYETAHLAPILDAAGNAILHRLNRVAAHRAEDLAVIDANAIF